MATSTDSTLLFFSKASPEQWSYIYSHYVDALKTKAARRTKKGGPEELIRLDNWYQQELPKLITSRKDPHITHDELLQITKWKLMRERYRPNLTDLVRINTEKAVFTHSKKAFQRLPNLSGAVGALTCLKGVGPATASAILAAGFPQLAPFMADECMISTPGVETMDYTIAEYLNYSAELKKRAEQLNKLDSAATWDPHKIELALWAHFVLGDTKTDIMSKLPPADTKHSNDEDSHKNPESADKDDNSVDSNQSSVDASNSEEDSNPETNLSKNGRHNSDEPPTKKICK